MRHVHVHEQCMSMRHFAECFLSWNFGLHLLHMYPARPVPTVSLRCALSYGELVHSSLHELQRAAPTARLVWRTTNAVCDSGFVGDWHDVIHAYSGSGSASYQLPSARRVCASGAPGGTTCQRQCANRRS